MMRRRQSLIWLQGLLCGAMATLATPTTLLLTMLLAPSLLALALDRKAGRPKARSIALANMAASVAPLHSLWAGGHTMSAAIALLTDGGAVAGAWSAAAGGWLLAELAPVAVRAALDGTSAARATRLRAERARLSAAWGLEEDQRLSGADQRQRLEAERSTAA